MKRILVGIFALLFWGGAMADLVTRHGANELRLQPTPCVHGGTLGHISEEWRPKFKKATAMIGSRMIYACWVDTMEGRYIVMFETGETMIFSITDFTDEPGV